MKALSIYYRFTKPVLVFVLLLGLLSSAVVVNAQGITGELTYTVADGIQLMVYAGPDFNSQIVSAVNPGNWRTEANQLADGWFKVPAGYINMSSEAILAFNFTPATGPTDEPGDTPPADKPPGGTNSIDTGGHLELTALTRLSTGYQVFLLFATIFLLIWVLLTYLLESIFEKRLGLLGAWLFWTALNAVILAILAAVNRGNENCFFQETICFSNTPAGYLLSGASGVLLPVGFVLIIYGGRRKQRPGLLSSAEHTRESGWVTMEVLQSLVQSNKGDGYLPTGDPVPGVGENSGKFFMTFVEMEEAAKFEFGPAILYILAFTVCTLFFAPFGLAYLGPVHFNVISDLTNGLRASAIALLAIAFIPTFFAIIEMMRENMSNPFAMGIWFLLWPLSYILPWPPLLNFAIFHAIAMASSGSGGHGHGHGHGKPFGQLFEGHSDWIAVTLLVGFSALILGYPILFASAGGWYLNDSTWVWDWATAGGQWMQARVP